jgi:2'-5' RNA ligase
VPIANDARSPAAAARLFFALWPDAAVRAHLGRWAGQLHRTCGGRLTRSVQLHVTLVFLGSVPRGRLPELCALARDRVGAGFSLCFDAPGYWPRRRLVWAAPRDVPEGLAALAGGLADGLRAAGFEIEARPYFPHITLIRDAGRPPPSAVEGFQWDVDDFVLVESRLRSDGSRYEVIGRWPLTRREAAAEATE